MFASETHRYYWKSYLLFSQSCKQFTLTDLISTHPDLSPLKVGQSHIPLHYITLCFILLTWTLHCVHTRILVNNVDHCLIFISGTNFCSFLCHKSWIYCLSASPCWLSFLSPKIACWSMVEWFLPIMKLVHKVSMLNNHSESLKFITVVDSLRHGPLSWMSDIRRSLSLRECSPFLLSIVLFHIFSTP